MSAVRSILGAMFLLPLLAIPVGADTEAAIPTGLPVFIECVWCDQDYLREELDYIDHVRDRRQAWVHILVSSRQAGGGGREFTLSFTGRERFEGLDDVLIVDVFEGDSEETRREKLACTMALGLTRYLARTDLAEHCKLEVATPASSAATAVVDPWNSWVFQIGLHGWGSGSKGILSSDFWNSLSANRITEQWKFESSISMNYSELRYDLSSGGESKTITRSHHAYLRLVKSLGEHWSLGATASGQSSSYNNIDFSANLTPAAEYSVFPYAESTRQVLTFRYRLGGGWYDYEEETLYGELEEALFFHGLETELELIRDWGSAGFRINARHYLHDFDLNHLNGRGNLSWKLLEGLSLSLRASYAAIHDQLALPAVLLSDEDILLQRRQQETQYSWSMSMGLNYSFGSIYNNVVNPRF